ncbi:hypothetical protein [Wenjunlia vitaminophila]|uniref:hypothetical protein n=1 Tax=Wenjunlia vitaminophila TaxID=76728 RepID=UPI00036B1ECC|nr:hypothetical protein [Wenjunlia vitaminophila]
MTDVVLPTREQARALTDRIRVAVEGTWLLIQEAYTSRAWAVLGYASWDAYCTEEFGTTRLRLPREERQEVVASLRDSGLSTRAIAAAAGIDQKTVRNDLAAGGEEFSSPVLGADGKTYAARPAPEPASDEARLGGTDRVQPTGLGFQAAVTPRPTPAPPETAPPAGPRRRPLPEAWADAAHDLSRAAERLARLTDDDRFDRNRETTHHQMPDLLGALEHTTRLLKAMHLDQAPTSTEARRWWATSLHTLSDALTDVANSINQEK